MQTFNILSEELLKKGKETKYLNCPDSMLNIGISTWTPQSTFESQLKHSTVRLVIFTLQKLRTMYQSFLLIHLCKITRMNVLLLSINHSIISLSLRCLFFFFCCNNKLFYYCFKTSWTLEKNRRRAKECYSFNLFHQRGSILMS